MEAISRGSGPSSGRKWPLAVPSLRCRRMLTHVSQQIMAWQGFIRVDGNVYEWMGAAGGVPTVDQTDFSYTSTRSTFIMNVGGAVEMNVTFMSPVTPNDLARQSLTFSYLDVAVRSLDGGTHDVQLYSDVTAGKQEAPPCARASAHIDQNGPQAISPPSSSGATTRRTAWPTMSSGANNRLSSPRAARCLIGGIGTIRRQTHRGSVEGRSHPSWTAKLTHLSSPSKAVVILRFGGPLSTPGRWTAPSTPITDPYLTIGMSHLWSPRLLAYAEAILGPSLDWLAILVPLAETRFLSFTPSALPSRMPFLCWARTAA